MIGNNVRSSCLCRLRVRAGELGGANLLCGARADTRPRLSAGPPWLARAEGCAVCHGREGGKGASLQANLPAQPRH